MRKALVIGLVLLLGASMMVMAAGGSQGSTSSGVTTIRVWSNDAHNKTYFDDRVATFNRTIGAQQNIQVEYTVYGADWQTAMQMALDTGREPEMFKPPANVPNYIDQGKMLPWTEIPGIEKILQAQAPYHRNQSTIFNGVIYSVTLYGWYYGFHYNKALLQQAGYSAPPKTWAEFEQMAIRISQLAPDIYGYAMPLLWTPDYTTWMTEFAAASSVGHLYYDATTDTYKFADFTPYFETLGRIRDANAMFPGMENLSDDQVRAQFSAGKIGFIGGAGWNVGVLYDQFPFGGGTAGSPANPTGWDFAPMPTLDANPVGGTPISAGAQYYVSSQVRNDRAKLNAMQYVIELFCGDQTQMDMVTNQYHVPVRADISQRAPAGARPQYSTYGQVIGSRSWTMPSEPHDQLVVEGADRVAVIGQILTGQIPVSGIRAALTDLDTRYNAALQQAYTRNVIKRENFFDPTLDARIKGR